MKTELVNSYRLDNALFVEDRTDAAGSLTVVRRSAASINTSGRGVVEYDGFSQHELVSGEPLVERLETLDMIRI